MSPRGPSEFPVELSRSWLAHALRWARIARAHLDTGALAPAITAMRIAAQCSGRAEMDQFSCRWRSWKRVEQVGDIIREIEMDIGARVIAVATDCWEPS